MKNQSTQEVRVVGPGVSVYWISVETSSIRINLYFIVVATSAQVYYMSQVERTKDGTIIYMHKANNFEILLVAIFKGDCKSGSR